MAESIGLSDSDTRFLIRMKAAGWAMVPTDATRDMVAAGTEIAPGQARAVWNAMVAAAPGLGRHVE